MNTVRRIAKNTIFMLTGEIVGKCFTLLFIAIVARYLHAEGFGLLSFAIAFVAIFGIFSDIGFYELTVRDGARNRELIGKYAGNVLILKSIILTIIYALMCLSIEIVNREASTLVYILGLSIIFDSFSMVFNSVFQAFERLEFISFGKILRNALLIFGGLLVISRGGGITEIAYLYIISSFALLIYNLLISLRLVKIKLEFDFKLWHRIIREGFPFWASEVLP